MQPEGHQTLGPAEWDALVARGLKFPKYDGPSTFRFTAGTCLDPLLTGCAIRTRPVGPDETLIDGGLYLFECEWKDKDNPEKLKAYCDKMGVPVTEKNIVLKFLRFLGGEWWYQCNQGIGSLSKIDGIVTDMVVEVVPLGGQEQSEVRLGAETVICDTAQFGLNAASQIVSNYSATTVSTTVNIISHPVDTVIISASITTTGAPMAIDVGTSIAFTGAHSVNNGLTSAILDVYMDGTSIGSANWDGTTLGNSYTTGSPVLQVTLSATNSPAAGAHTYSLHLHMDGAGSVLSYTAACSNNFIKVREIKR